MKLKKTGLILILTLALIGVNESFAQKRNTSTKRETPAKVVKPSVKKTPPTTVHHGKEIVYTKPKPTVNALHSAPAKSKVVKKNGVDYHYHNGKYYKMVNNKYIVTPPPVGIHVPSLPVDFARMIIAGVTYYYSAGTYYNQLKTGEYEVVAAPVDAIVYSLPEEADEVTISGERYYVDDSILYQVVITPDGKGFKVVGSI